MATVVSEISYRELSISAEDALRDTIEAAACVAGRGNHLKDKYPIYLIGIKGIASHIYSENFSREVAARMACKVMYIAACVFKNTEYQKITDPTVFLQEDISKSKYGKLSSLRRLDAEAFAYLIQAIRLLQE